MVICGPCIVMTPSQGTSKKHTRIPTFNTRTNSTANNVVTSQSIGSSKLPKLNQLAKDRGHTSPRNVPDFKSTNLRRTPVLPPKTAHSTRAGSTSGAVSLALPNINKRYVSTQPLKPLKETTLHSSQHSGRSKPYDISPSNGTPSSCNSRGKTYTSRSGLPKATKTIIPRPKLANTQSTRDAAERKSNQRCISEHLTKKSCIAAIQKTPTASRNADTKLILNNLRYKYKIKTPAHGLNNDLTDSVLNSVHMKNVTGRPNPKGKGLSSKHYLGEECNQASSSQRSSKLRGDQNREKHDQMNYKLYPVEFHGQQTTETDEDYLFDESSDSQDMLDFSIASGEELASDDDCSSVVNEEIKAWLDVSDDEDESENKSAATVIYKGEMQKSNDTNEDSFDSLEETSAEPFRILDLVKEEEEGEEEEQIQGEEEQEEEESIEAMSVSEQDTSAGGGGSNSDICHGLLSEKEFQHHFLANSSPKSSKFCSSSEVSTSQSGSTSDPFYPSDDDSDFIEIDCDVQPMQALHRPLVYGYASRLPALTRQMISDRKTSTGSSVDLNKYPQQRILKPQDPNWSESTNLFSNNIRQTYWDYYKTKNNPKNVKTHEDFECDGEVIKDPFELYNENRYDPEILLAQMTHPKSLTNATFNEYSSQVKSSILERLSSQSDSDDVESSNGYDRGSQLELSGKTEVGFIDPGYYSESDVTKLRNKLPLTHKPNPSRQNKTKEVLGCAPYLISKSPISRPRTSGPNPNGKMYQNEFVYQDPGLKLTQNRYTWNDPYSDDIIDHRTSLGEDPWMKLLINAMSPSKDKNVSDGEIWTESFRRDPSISSLPAWPSANSRDSVLHLSEVIDFAPIHGDGNFSKKPPPSPQKEPKPKKAKKKSFLPSYFRRKTNKSSQSSPEQETVSNYPSPTPSSFHKSSSQKLQCGSPFIVQSPFAKSTKKLPRSPSGISNAISEESSSSSSKSNRSASSKDSVLTAIRTTFQSH